MINAKYITLKRSLSISQSSTINMLIDLDHQYNLIQNHQNLSHHHCCQNDIHSNTRSLHPRPLVLGRFCVFYSFYLWALQFTKWINVYIVYVMIIIIVAKMIFIQIPGAFILALVSGPRQRLSSCLLSGIIREH